MAGEQAGDDDHRVQPFEHGYRCGLDTPQADPTVRN
jgi:hypothetical protein